MLTGNQIRKLYLFKSGIFYLGLDEDAKKLSELFDFKMTDLNKTIKKVGFPAKKIDYYAKLLNACSVDFEIIDETQTKIENFNDYLHQEEIKNILLSVKKLDMNTISFQDAFYLLKDLNEKLKNFE